ncbi:solute carrier family 22 member 7-like isoform X2 [Dermacentor albipictus]
MFDVTGHGAFQLRLLVCATLSTGVLLAHSLAYRVLARPVRHWCAPPDDLALLPVEVWRNVAVPLMPDGSLSQCTVYDPPVPDLANAERRVVPCERWQYDEANGSIVGQWDLVCHHRWLLPLSSVLYLVGALLGLPLVGLAADCLGRKPVVICCVGALLFAGTSCGVARSFDSFVLSRLVVALTSGGTQLLLFVLLYEACDNGHRLTFSLLCWGTASALLPLVLQLISVMDERWEKTQVALMVPTCLLVLVCFLLEESPAWLLASYQPRLAEEAALAMAVVNGVPPTRVKLAFAALLMQADAQHQSARESAFLFTQAAVLRKTVFRCHHLPELCSSFTVMLAFYSANLGPAETAPHSFLGSVAVAFLVSAMYAAVYWSTARFGPRLTFAAVTWLLALQSIVQASKVGQMTAVVGFTVAATAMGATYVYSIETFPSEARCVGMGACYSVGCIGAAVAVIADPPRQILHAIAAVLAFLSLTGLHLQPYVVGVKKHENHSSAAERKKAMQESLVPIRAAVTNSMARHASRSSSISFRRGSRARAPTDTSSALDPRHDEAVHMDLVCADLHGHQAQTGHANTCPSHGGIDTHARDL